MDLMIDIDRFPAVGETILGDGMDYMVGGKGANQAVAAAKVGYPTTMLTKLGSDSFGDHLYKHLENNEIDLSKVEIERNLFSGIATVFRQNGDNSIIVVPGVNYTIDKEYVDRYIHLFDKDDILLCSLEIPVETVKYALKIAKEKGLVTILNPAPFQKAVLDLLPYVDYVTPNESEFLEMIDSDQQKLTSQVIQAKVAEMKQQFNCEFIVTQGGGGVSYSSKNRIHHIDSIQVEVKDSTGAGDTFNGLFAAFLGKNFEYDRAIQLASIGASLSCRMIGAQTGMPSLELILETEKN